MRRPLRPALAAAAALLFVVPLVLMVTGSLRAAGLPPPRGPELLPDPVTLSSYERAFELVDRGRYAANSVLVAGIAVPLAVLLASWAGFAISQLPPRLSRAVVALSFIALMVPTTALLVPRFALFRTLGVLDTYVPLVAPACRPSTSSSTGGRSTACRVSCSTPPAWTAQGRSAFPAASRREARLRRPGGAAGLSGGNRGVQDGGARRSSPARRGERSRRSPSPPRHVDRGRPAPGPLSPELPLLRPVRRERPTRADRATAVRVGRVRGGRLLPRGARRLPLRRRTQLPAPEHLESRRLLQQGALPEGGPAAAAR
jgi:hypothetical protein